MSLLAAVQFGITNHVSWKYVAHPCINKLCPIKASLDKAVNFHTSSECSGIQGRIKEIKSPWCQCRGVTRLSCVTTNSTANPVSIDRFSKHQGSNTTLDILGRVQAVEERLDSIRFLPSQQLKRLKAACV